MRLRQIALVARDLERVSAELADVLGLGEPFADPGVSLFGLANAVFPVGDTFLEVVSPVKADTSAGRFLERRGGDGGYMVIVQTKDRVADRKRVDALGVRVVWETELPDISTIHLHPRDVGGAILSLDVADPPDAWRWGGADWQARSRLDVTRSLAAVEMHSADPGGMARRWSQVLGRPVTEHGVRAFEIPLDESSIRFAETPEGGAEGLAGFDVAVTDRGRVLEAARAHGFLGEDGRISICGTKIGLL